MTITEKEKQQIQKEAKEILTKFAQKLEKIKENNEPTVERKEDKREEDEDISNPIDRKIMFENAPNKSGDFITAEKGEW